MLEIGPFTGNERVNADRCSGAVQVVFALIRAPHLGPAEKETLLRREPVDLLFARLWFLSSAFCSAA